MKRTKKDPLRAFRFRKEVNKALRSAERKTGMDHTEIIEQCVLQHVAELVKCRSEKEAA